ncbi:hypothetical protein BpHYR1_001556 [Brachionus plicatilis]|uniref:Uncharacterized protein n=1 Tax=Brachionus plicatilis TaxID=10195 RepID=A0A3M7Q9C8_BRAPC|nr:hypothetical protein BpHYR1_001556 [Brachionus plicatilis]
MQSCRNPHYEFIYKLCKNGFVYCICFLMVCILQKIAEFLQSLEFFCTNLYNIVLLMEPFLHNLKINYNFFTFCTYVAKQFLTSQHYSINFHKLKKY